MNGRMLLGGALLAILLAACDTPAGVGRDAATPVTLSYPYEQSEEDLFPGYDAIVGRAADSYVALTIVADEKTAAEAGRATVNSASGIVIADGGYVLTAAHIAIDARYHALVTTIDGRELRGDIIDVDRDRELALIRLPADPGIPAATLADAGELAVGDHVFAIGSPRNSTGVVSLGRVKETRLPYRLDYAGFSYANAIVLAMQVEPGHSGGPLFDAEGRLIGMTASFDLYQPRIAFAVPSNDIVAYLDAVAGR